MVSRFDRTWAVHSDRVVELAREVEEVASVLEEALEQESLLADLEGRTLVDRSDLAIEPFEVGASSLKEEVASDLEEEVAFDLKVEEASALKEEVASVLEEEVAFNLEEKVLES